MILFLTTWYKKVENWVKQNFFSGYFFLISLWFINFQISLFSPSNTLLSNFLLLIFIKFFSILKFSSACEIFFCWFFKYFHIYHVQDVCLTLSCTVFEDIYCAILCYIPLLYYVLIVTWSAFSNASLLMFAVMWC